VSHTGVYLDTSGLFALFDADDSGHPAAAQAWEALLPSDTTLHTSSYVRSIPYPRGAAPAAGGARAAGDTSPAPDAPAVATMS
jgi:hypothetical protein